jgi:glutathione S-transferase
MITLYGRPGTASSAPMAVFDGLGVAHRYVTAGDDPDAFRAAHPLGFVPAVVWDDGSTTVESAAIVLHALDRFDADNTLRPAPGTAESARFLEALAFLAAQVYPTYQRMYQTRRMGPEDLWPTIRAYARDQQETHWDFLDARLAGRDGVSGAGLSAADIYLLMLVTWWPDVAELCRRRPNIARACRLALNQDYVVRAFDRHDQAADIAQVP